MTVVDFGPLIEAITVCLMPVNFALGAVLSVLLVSLLSR